MEDIFSFSSSFFIRSLFFLKSLCFFFCFNAIFSVLESPVEEFLQTTISTKLTQDRLFFMADITLFLI